MILISALIAGCSGSDDSEIMNANFTVRVTTKTPQHPYFGQGSSLGYVVNGVEGRELTLKRGTTYTFSISTPGHPFYITIDSVGDNSGIGEVTEGVSGSRTQDGTLMFTPTAAHPDTLYYHCWIHPNMGWMINIID